MVPQGLQYADESFKTAYGASPDIAAAKKTLADAGVKTPVPLEVWWTPSHYGASSGDEYAAIKQQLDSSGLFDVTLKSTEWTQYSTAAFTNKYPLYQLGWFPDYPDADDYTASFYSKDSFLNIGYNDPQMEKLLADEKASTDTAQRQKDFDQIQKIGAEQVPMIPIWQARPGCRSARRSHGRRQDVRPGVHLQVLADLQELEQRARRLDMGAEEAG